LRLPDGVPASVAAKDVPQAAGKPLSSVLQKGKEVAAVVTDIFERNGKGTVTLTMAGAGAHRPVPPPKPSAPVLPGIFQLTEETDPSDLAHALRQRDELTVSFAGLPSPLVAAFGAYLLGLASAVPAGKAEWPQPQRMVVRRPYPPVP